jgi:hypothetical protein
MKKRPVVYIELPEDQHKADELFQNQVLRPILKMQHKVIYGYAMHAVENLNKNWAIMDRKKKDDAIRSVIQKDSKVKNTLIGCVIGQLSEAELVIYLKDTKGFDKRISQMVLERILSVG